MLKFLVPSLEPGADRKRAVPMRAVLRVNLGWSVLLLARAVSVVSFDSVNLAFLAATLAYVLAAFLALRGSRVAVAISALVAVLVAGYWLPWSVYNAYLFAAGHEPYLDSPGTILIVGLETLLYTLPATALSAYYLVTAMARQAYPRSQEE